jgi:GAF domain-containing protein
MPNPVFDEILAALESFAQTAENAEDLQKLAVETIAARLPHYNWVGFYMLDPTDDNMLILGPFVGAPTLHTRIPVTEGICGAAVAQGQTIVVDDVRSDPRYLACSIETQSEIVAPVRVHGQVVGEIDIDSHQRATFTPEDRAFVERCAHILGTYLEQPAKY